MSDSWTTPRILFLIDIFVKSKQGLKGATIPQLPLEIAVVEGVGEGRAEPVGSSSVGIRSAHNEDKGKVISTPRSGPRPAETTPLDEKIQAGLRASSGGSSPQVPRVKNDGMMKNISLSDLKEKWPEVLKRAQEENHSLPFLLSTSEPTQVENGVLQVGVQYPFHCEKLNEQKSRAVLEKVVSEIYGIPLQTQAVVSVRVAQKSNAVDDVLNAFGGRLVE